MKAAPFSYVRATSREDAIKRLVEAGPEARVIAGGQSLLAALAFRLSEPPVLVDIGRIEDLRGITVEKDILTLGALTRHRDLATSPLVATHAPLLRQAAHYIAHPAIRNRGTIGGSLAYADPAAELPACIIALAASIVVAGVRGERRIPAEAFFKGLFETVLAPGELIVGVEIPSAPATRRAATIYEIARRSGDYAMAGVALTARVEAGKMTAPRAVFFGLGDTAMFATKTAAALDGAADATAAVAAISQDLSPPADQHGSAETKLHLARVVLQRAVADLLAGGRA